MDRDWGTSPVNDTSQVRHRIAGFEVLQERVLGAGQVSRTAATSNPCSALFGSRRFEFEFLPFHG